MFGLGKKTYLGIDFGTASIKVVELGLEGNDPVLLNYGEADLTQIETLQGEDQGNFDARITVFLRALLEKMRPHTKEAFVAMPAFIGLVALVEFPDMKDEELREAIQFEAHKYVPSSLEEVALSWEIVGEQYEGTPEEPVKKLEVLLVAALNKEVERYESYIQSVEYSMHYLELETFALARSVVRDMPEPYVIVDIGSRATNIVLVENSLVKMSRNLDVGGQDITRTLVESLRVGYDRAETLKKSEKDFLNAPESRLTFLPFELIANEVNHLLDARQSKNPQAPPIHGIILSGGTAGMNGLPEYFSKLIGIPVEKANPWRGIRYPEHLRESVERMGTSYSVALGLAWRGFERKKQKSLKDQFAEWKQSIKKLMTKKIGK